MTDFTLTPTLGSVPGMLIQFVEGRWPGPIGEGVAVTDGAFDSIVPHLLAACPGWTPMDRYGFYDLSPPACSALAQLLRAEGERLCSDEDTTPGKAAMFEGLADWLLGRCDAGQPLSILGY